MPLPAHSLNLDVETISGICGSISVACWVVVFSPQIIQNLQRRSADALSTQFIIVWLIGDIFNIIGAVLQHVLSTMIILAVYYTLADIILLVQCFHYRGFTWKDTHMIPAPANRPDERAALLPDSAGNRTTDGSPDGCRHEHRDWTKLSPAVPLVSDACQAEPPTPLTVLQTAVWNTFIVVMVCAAGVLGWLLGRKAPPADGSAGGDAISLSVPGQVFGYLCAAVYIGSRLPQLVLNHRRRSTEGLSMLFFLFACLGDVTYVLSILAYMAPCSRRGGCAPGAAAAEYARYILVNLSWLLGSSLTLLLDLCVFAQYFVYGKIEDAPVRARGEPSDGSPSQDEEVPAATRRVHPLLGRGDSNY